MIIYNQIYFNQSSQSKHANCLTIIRFGKCKTSTLSQDSIFDFKLVLYVKENLGKPSDGRLKLSLVELVRLMEQKNVKKGINIPLFNHSCYRNIMLIALLITLV
ncbi:hypothetical protein BpHYR1_030970 [Brachionus plicatilis]|uniref:Uncharacterized protein n=1 Tax=Brachionus plicatilis TaxID=10195 RepID=A0A3M7SVT9_BRAPC|nr:hypothetical protein BpHYR1_030970 [Brachionus plicatilis]